MAEFDLILETKNFQSKETIKNDLTELNIRPGDSLIVHSSMKSIGWLAGGAQAVIEALMETITKEGTIVMPAQSAENSDPMYWMLPPVPEDWHQPIRDTWPAYDPHLTPLRGMGKIAECFHRHPETIRSPHPAHSFMAWGKHAEEWMKEHPLEESFSEKSPLGKMIEEDVKLLLIGVGYDSCTALHLSEYRQEKITFSPQGAAMMINGKREWKTYEMADVDSDRFPEIGEAFETAHPEAFHTGKIGQADVKLIQMKPLVEYGTTWLNEHPVVEE
ncbi:aminoglycoside N(3)-acetyltransferase [Chungangia koreensis]|uniref:Aminoglycoside N(3)-acetyltransferase n=1 Tax=Chungangia koreensis TaxID=752657 RepID=A0ABV8X9U5_9LACT